MDANTTNKFPVFAMLDEYKMPAVGQEVLVLHLPTGQAAGIVLGKMWNKMNTPRKAGEHVYSQEFGDEPGESYMEYDGADGDLKFRDKNTDVVTLTELLGLKETDKHRREFGDEPGEAYTREYDLDVTYYISKTNAARAVSIQAAVSDAVAGYNIWQTEEIGRDINPSELIRRMVAAGAKRVTVDAPAFVSLPPSTVARTGSVTVTYGGIEDD